MDLWACGAMGNGGEGIPIRLLLMLVILFVVFNGNSTMDKSNVTHVDLYHTIQIDLTRRQNSN